ncbi:MAG: AAA family ATPase [Myxococcota bacterium]
MNRVRTQADAFRRAFGETSDPGAHVPRAATEAVLARLSAWRRTDAAGSTVAALIAPPGLGKSHLLRVLESAAHPPTTDLDEDAPGALAPGRRPRSIYLPYAALGLPDLVRWIRGLAGQERDGADAALDSDRACIASLAALSPAPDQPLELLIDDADSMPPATLRALAQGLDREQSPVRIVLALGDDSRAARMLAALDALEPLELFFRDPLDTSEVEDYLEARLARAGLGSEALDGLDGRTVSRIHALSGGFPRRIHRVVLALVEPDRAALARALASSSPSDAWLGRPIDDPF